MYLQGFCLLKATSTRRLLPTRSRCKKNICLNESPPRISPNIWWRECEEGPWSEFLSTRGLFTRFCGMGEDCSPRRQALQPILCWNPSSQSKTFCFKPRETPIIWINMGVSQERGLFWMWFLPGKPKTETSYPGLEV